MKLLRHTNPWTPAPMEDWFGKAFADFGDLTRWIGRADPFERFSRPHLSADLFEDDQNYYARVEVPGARKDEVSIRMEGGMLHIAYERKGGEDGDSLALTRSFRLPGPVDTAQIKAKLEDGLLTVTLPRHEDAKPRAIAIE